MRKILLTAAIALSALQLNATDVLTGEKLPVRRVVLYKNGVGYFEHSGQVRGSQELKIDFTSAQLNDALKSLTVLDLNGGKISGVGYNSVAPVAEQLRSLRLPLGESTTLADFLNALRGTRVEVRNGPGVVSGRLLSVEEKTAHKGQEETTKTLEISLVTASGEVRAFPMTPGLGLRVADHDLNDEIGKYLNLVSSARDQDLRQMTIATAGTGERGIFVSYISEVPVWKSTYRILLPEKGDSLPLLQGWAIVDNTVGEDWKDVELSLVAGAPQSFIQDLSKPYYTRRPVVGLPETAMLTPQTHEGTMQEFERLETYGKLNKAAESVPPPPPPPPPATGAFGTPLQSAGGVLGGLLGAAVNINGQPPSDSNGLISSNGRNKKWLADKAENTFEPAASGQELGDLFQYNLKEKVTILKNHSALVPIISEHIKADKVTLWNRGAERPLRALWITNSSGLTLDGGTFSVIEDSAFAGEGLIDPLKPQERRLLSYAVDQAVRVEHRDDMEARPITHIKIGNGVLVKTSEQRNHQLYTIRNTDTEARDVIIEHPVRLEWKLAGDAKAEETSASYYRFRVKVEPNKTAELKVEEVQPLEQTVALASLTDDKVRIWFNDRTIKPEVVQALHKIVDQKNQISGLDGQIKTRQDRLTSINLDQQRLRENMKALKGSAEEKALVQRYARELNQQEDRLQATREEVDKLAVQRAESQKELDQMMEDLKLDETI